MPKKPTNKKSAKKPEKEAASEADVMDNPEYLRKSGKLITDALRKGMDVLQLDNGDVVTTGTKVIVTRYTWDEKTGKMVKSSARQKHPLKK